MGLCSGYTPATGSSGGSSQSVLQFVGAWDPFNPDRRDALYARLSWCLAVAGPASPCDVTKLIQVDDSGAGGNRVAYWAWAGWYSSEAAIQGFSSALTAPAVLTYNCSGASSQAGIF